MRRLLGLLVFANVMGTVAFGQKNVYIRRDKFASEALGNPVSVENFEKQYGKFLTITKKTRKEDTDTSVVDTIYTFLSGKTKVVIFHGKEKDFLLSAYIDTDKIPLKYNIKVGDTRAFIEKQLKTKITKDKVQVGDLEHGQVYTFSFSNNKLISISYDGYVD